MVKKKRCKAKAKAFAGRKAQMAAFILIGLVLLIGISVFSYMMYIAKKAPTDQYIIEQLPETLDKLSLETLISSCIKKTSEPQLVKIAKYGGTINPKLNEYKLYNHTRYRYLCEQMPGYTKCVNRVITRESMQKLLEQKITTEMVACVVPALKFYEDRGYEIEANEVSTRVMIGTDEVNVIVTYPLLISKGRSKISVVDHSAKFDYPLGKLYDLAMIIINSENSDGYFDQEDWMYKHSAEIIIQKHRPYPDIVYKISKYNRKKGGWQIFNFALQGYDKLPELSGLGSLGTSGQMISSPMATQSNAYDQDLGCCYNEKDGNCFENGDKSQCSYRNLEWRIGSCIQGGFECSSLSENKYDNEEGKCYGGSCFSCAETYNDGDDINDPSSYTGPSKSHGESWCVYEGPAGNGFDAVGSRHYKHVCIDGWEMVEECRDYRDEMCVEERTDVNGRQMTRAVCRPNRWQDCHLYSTNQAECEDSSKRDCFWNTYQEDFVIGKPRDQSITRVTPYEDRGCTPHVPPGLRFWNTMEGMQVCGWANNYYECAAPGCFQEWTDFDAVYCAFQGDCGVYANYIGKLPTLSLSNLFPGSGQMPGVGGSAMGGGFVAMPNQISSELFDYTLPSEDNFRFDAYKHMDDVPTYPVQREQIQVTPEMFIHNSPNDYSSLGTMTFIQEVMQWGLGRLSNIEDDIWDLIVNGESLEWDAIGISSCGIWMPTTSAVDCEKCNDNPYRPCTEYRCKSLGLYCNYEEIGGVGKCTSYGTSTIGKPVVKFDGQITPDYTTKTAVLLSSENVYLGKEIKEPIASDYTFQIKTNRETQCMLTMVPGASFGLNPPFPGTSTSFSFNTRHNLTIPYTSADTLSVMLLPLELVSMISFDPDQMFAGFQSIGQSAADYIGDIADDCHDCNPISLDCSDTMLIFLSSSDCDDMDDSKDDLETSLDDMTTEWNDVIKPQVEQWMGVAQQNAIDELLNYAAQSKYHAFIKCRDRGGNENEADFDFIRFKINPNPLDVEEIPDTAPEITAIMPQNWTEQSPEGDGNKMIGIRVNQLAECAYDTSDKEFIYMENKFQCPTSTYAGSLGGGYTCNASIPFSDLTNEGTPLNIKCIDHPEHYETFNFRIEPGSNFAAPSGIRWVEPEVEGEDGTVIVKNPKLLNSSMPTIIVPTTSVKFFMELKRTENDHEKAIECRYATSPEDVESASTMLIDPETGDNECNNCTAMLGVSGTDFYVSCHFKSEERNEGAAVQYVLQEAAAS